MENGKGTHAVGLVNGVGFGSTEFHVLRSKEDTSPRFIFHWCNSSGLRQAAEVQMTGSAGQKRVPADFFSKYFITRLDSVEQRTIAAILDTMDEAIRQTEAVIAKLRQVKTGMLHDLLTRGLDENGELRDPIHHPEQFKNSPLGLIPNEWNVQPLKFLSEFVTSGSRGWAQYYADQGSLFLRIGNLTREHINLRYDDLVHVRPPKGTEGARTKVIPGDLLVSITADLGIIGCVSEDIGDAYVNQHIALVRPLKEINPRWCAHYLASPSYQKQFTLLNDSGAKAGLNLTSIGNLLVSIPDDNSEQSQIVRSLDEIDGQVETKKVYLRKQILLKQGLMHDLLTGTIRVPPHLLEATS
jgi:type I restriction enzyme S subunit